MDEGITIVGPDAFPEEWLARIKPELAPGERLIWAGEAKPAKGLSGRLVAIIWALGFSLIALFAFAGLFGAFGVVLERADHLLATVGVIASAIAFLILIGLTAHALGSAADRPAMHASLYALTDARAISWIPSGRGVTVSSTPRGTIKSVHRIEYADGSGSVLFGTSPQNEYGVANGFLEVNDARRVEALVRLHLIADPSTL